MIHVKQQQHDLYCYQAHNGDDNPIENVYYVACINDCLKITCNKRLIDYSK